ncbi:helix-turn-helix domain-containing protein [Sodalinema gerasimenkoae]|uniref:helix-turn-helix domain-containing protein n=1 Tax=Sodalinema gerasimenkoae TaxID=2862348 RepID=UPI001358CE0B|nr:IS630 transposase-related protein [Sodalinema gerasimenkoae]
MSNNYSYDLRQKVIKAIEIDGMKKSEVSQIFGISRNTIYLWLKQKEETGDFQPREYRPPGHGHKIKDVSKFQAFVEEHADKTQAEMAKLWDDEISQKTISRWLKKLGFTRKKNRWVLSKK